MSPLCTTKFVNPICICALTKNPSFLTQKLSVKYSVFIRLYLTRSFSTSYTCTLIATIFIRKGWEGGHLISSNYNPFYLVPIISNLSCLFRAFPFTTTLCISTTALKLLSSGSAFFMLPCSFLLSSTVSAVLMMYSWKYSFLVFSLPFLASLTPTLIPLNV